jgi:hypothetical protein
VSEGSLDGNKLKASSQNMCVSVLLLVEKLVSMKVDVLRRSSLHFFALLTRATLLSMPPALGDSLPTYADERSLLLGASLIFVMSVDTDMEISSDLSKNLMTIASQFASFCRHQVGGLSETGHKHAQEAMSVVSRSILSALLSAPCSSDQAVSFSHCLVSTISDKGTLQELVAIIPTLDDNVFSLLQRLATSGDGAKFMVEYGILSALVRGKDNYVARERRELDELSIGVRLPSDIDYVPSFVAGHLGLLNTLLASQSLSPKVREEVCRGSIGLLVQYKEILQRVRKNFPRNVDVWMEFVRCLSLLRSSPCQGDAVLRWSQSRTITVPPALEEMVISVSLNLLENPFPPRVLSVLPAGLTRIKTDNDPARMMSTEANIPVKTWWDVIESCEGPVQAVGLPDPSFGNYFMGASTTSTRDTWSDHKYEASVAGARILDISLSFLCAEARVHDMKHLDVQAFARGFCRCIDTTRVSAAWRKFVCL